MHSSTFLLLPSALLQIAYATLPPVTPTATSTLIPPYTAGSATYYATSLGSDNNGTSYAITCIPPSTTASPTANSDPCQTSLFGNSTLTFYQGSSIWQVIHSSSASGYHSTACSPAPSFRTKYTYITTGTGAFMWDYSTIMPSAVPTCQAFPTPYACFAYDDQGEQGLAKDPREVGMCDLGLSNQEVLMVEELPTTSFTDIGRSATTQGPVQTVTLHKTGGNAGVQGKSVGRGAVAFSLMTFVVFELI